MARRIAGITKDDESNKILESRVGLFLTSSSHGAQFTIQCVGPTKASRMELEGDPTEAKPDDADACDTLDGPRETEEQLERQAHKEDDGSDVDTEEATATQEINTV